MILLHWKPGRTAADCYSYFHYVKTNLILCFLVNVAGFTHVLAKQSISSLLPITCFQMFSLNMLQKPGFSTLLDCGVQHCITAIYFTANFDLTVSFSIASILTQQWRKYLLSLCFLYVLQRYRYNGIIQPELQLCLSGSLFCFELQIKVGKINTELKNH